MKVFFFLNMNLLILYFVFTEAGSYFFRSFIYKTKCFIFPQKGKILRKIGELGDLMKVDKKYRERKRIGFL